MKAIEITNFGAPQNLVLTERPTPSPEAGEVLIKVQAAGINRPDCLQRQGHYPPPEGITDIPGLEVAGIIEDSRDERWKKGDKVCALIAGGGYAEYAVAPAGQCLPVPDSLSMIEAAALPETIFTVWSNLFERGRLARGETVLIHGGSSGIGTIAIQMAKHLGARVITTAGDNKKCAACRDIGADLAINYKTCDFAQEIEKEYGQECVNVVLDMIGNDYVPRNLRLLALDGRHVSIAFLKGRDATIDIRSVMKKRLILTGSTLRARPVAEKEALARGLYDAFWPVLAEGKIKPVIYKSLPLEDAAKAHEIMESSAHIGKLVLEVF